MALSGIQIYKLLPQTNCKDCGFPTCLAFAMKLAAKQVELSSCPHVADDAKAQLSEAAEPPIRLVTLRGDGHEAKAGNEVVLFRHEKRFFHKTGIFVRICDNLTPDEIKDEVKTAESYTVDYVGMDLKIDGFAVDAMNGDDSAFAAAVGAIREVSKLPLVLMSQDPDTINEGVKSIDGEYPLIHGANANNWEAMAELALRHETALSAIAPTLDDLADLTTKLKDKGVNDLVLEPSPDGLGTALMLNTQIRRLALKANYRPLGYPIISIPDFDERPAQQSTYTAQAIAKYAGFVVVDNFAAETMYPLLVLRENIYTDPQKPIQVQAGLYEINNPKPEDPVLVTTNFSITYFSVANEVESAGLPAWLLVTDAEGMSVLTAWAAGKFDAERIAKSVKTFEVADKVTNRNIILPGHTAVLSGELEEELPDWQVRVGPREAVDLPSYLKQVL